MNIHLPAVGGGITPSHDDRIHRAAWEAAVERKRAARHLLAADWL